ncbi:hypothetical protein [Streptomyces sp. LN549]|uniref:hypothetical protein n=1 Tax=Streptomyces sp. LN549 TaxID=3112979 RepID=UPI00371AD274
MKHAAAASVRRSCAARAVSCTSMRSALLGGGIDHVVGGDDHGLCGGVDSPVAAAPGRS